MSYKFFRILYLSVGALFLVAALILGGTLYSNGKLFLMPGPLSEVAARGEVLEGYSNHADFEQSCGHCHTPVHCITDTGCQDCHMDVAMQRSTGVGLHARLPGTSRCQNCHIEHKGREMVLTEFSYANIDHTLLSGFSLDKHQDNYDGSHLNCESCHSQSRFVADTLDCITCHSQEDHDYIAGHIETYGLSCVPCHDGLDSMAAFDHEQVYPLEGGHTQVDCNKCHAELAFAGTPSECNDCHEKTMPNAAIFGEDCERCHTTVAWAPALLTQHTFSLTHGSDEQLACESCHVEEYMVKSCYECHDHQPDQMLVAHLSEQVYVIDRCEECHPTGEEGEAERLRAQWEPLRSAETAWIEQAFLYSGGTLGSPPPAPGEPEEITGAGDQKMAAQPEVNESLYFQQTSVKTSAPDSPEAAQVDESPAGKGENYSAGPYGEDDPGGIETEHEDGHTGEKPVGGDMPEREGAHAHRLPH